MILFLINGALYLAACFCFYKTGWHGGKAEVYQERADWSRAQREAWEKLR